MLATLNGLTGTLSINCDPTSSNSTSGAKCSFVQEILVSLFGPDGLSLTGCTFGECVAQGVIDDTQASTTGSGGGHGRPLGGGVIAGLAVVGTLVGLAIFAILLGLWRRRKARREGMAKGLGLGRAGGVAVTWKDVSYAVDKTGSGAFATARRRKNAGAKVVLDHVSGRVAPGQMMAVLGPSGAGKTTLLEILAGKEKSGQTSGSVSMDSPTAKQAPRIAFVPQQDVLPPLLTVHEALLFAARLRLPEHIPKSALIARVDALIAQLGLERVRDSRIGGNGKRGLSGGEMRRVSIGLELVGSPDIVLLDEPTSGLDAVSAANVARVLRGVANGVASSPPGSGNGNEDGNADALGKTAVIATIHQPSSGLYRLFDRVVLLSQGRAMYVGEGGMEPVHALRQRVNGHGAHEWTEGYNVADWLLEVASEEQWRAEVAGRNGGNESGSLEKANGDGSGVGVGEVTQSLPSSEQEKHIVAGRGEVPAQGVKLGAGGKGSSGAWTNVRGPSYATTFLTQFETLAGREWKILRR